MTITLDDETATWLRMCAAASNVSVSRVVRAILKQGMSAEHEYDEAMRRRLAKVPAPLKLPGSHYVGRDEIHDRGRQR